MRPLPLVLLVLAAAGCARAATVAGDRASVRSATLVEACALGVPGTRIQLAEAPDGVHVFLTTWPSRVGELRERVLDQAAMHGPGLHQGQGHFGEHEGPRSHGLRLWTLGPIRVNTEEIPGGARLVVAPVDLARRAEVRDAIARRVAAVQAAACAD